MGLSLQVSEVELQAQANLFKHADVSVQTRALSFVEEALSQGKSPVLQEWFVCCWRRVTLFVGN